MTFRAYIADRLVPLVVGAAALAFVALTAAGAAWFARSEER